MQWYHILQKNNIIELESSVEKMQLSSQKIARLYIDIEKKQSELELLRTGKLKRKDIKDHMGNPIVSPRYPPKSSNALLQQQSNNNNNNNNGQQQGKAASNNKENNNNPFEQADNALLRLDTMTAQAFHELDPENSGSIAHDQVTEVIKKVQHILLLLIEEQDIPRQEQAAQFGKYLESSNNRKEAANANASSTKARVTMTQFRQWYTLKYYENLFRTYRKKMKQLKEPSMEAQQQTLMLSIATERSLEQQLQDIEKKMKETAANSQKCMVM